MSSVYTMLAGGGAAHTHACTCAGRTWAHALACALTGTHTHTHTHAQKEAHTAPPTASAVLAWALLQPGRYDQSNQQPTCSSRSPRESQGPCCLQDGTTCRATLQRSFALPPPHGRCTQCTRCDSKACISGWSSSQPGSCLHLLKLLRCALSKQVADVSHLSASHTCKLASVMTPRWSMHMCSATAGE